MLLCAAAYEAPRVLERQGHCTGYKTPDEPWTDPEHTPNKIRNERGSRAQAPREMLAQLGVEIDEGALERFRSLSREDQRMLCDESAPP